MVNGETVNYEKGQFYILPLFSMKPDPDQPRKYFDPNAMDELTASVARHGILQPILVRQDSGGQIYIVAGERRYTAAQNAGIQTIPVIFVNGNHSELAIIENLLRQDLTAVEEAEALKRMIKEQGYKQEDLAKVIGKSASTISEILSLNRLPSEIRDECRASHSIPRRTLVEIAKSKQQRAMVTLFNKYKDKHLSREEVKKQARRHKKTDFEQTIELLDTIQKRISVLTPESCTPEVKDRIIPVLKALQDTITERITVLNQSIDCD